MTVLSFQTPGFENLNLAKLQTIPGVESVNDTTLHFSGKPESGKSTTPVKGDPQIVVLLENGVFLSIVRASGKPGFYDAFITYGNNSEADDYVEDFSPDELIRLIADMAKKPLT